MGMKRLTRLFACVALGLALTVPAMAQEAKQMTKVLITNANVFDGQNEQLAEGMSVLVEGNKIAKIA